MKFNKEYIVNVQGKVLGNKSSDYTVYAKSDEEASRIAKEQFSKENETYGEQTVELNAKKLWLSILSVVCLAVVIYIAFTTNIVTQPATKGLFNTGLGAKSEKTAQLLAPNIISVFTSIALLIIFLFKFKTLQSVIVSPFEIIHAVLVVIAVASLLEILLDANDIKLLGFIPLKGVNGQTFFWGAIIFSFFSINSISGFCYIGVIITGLINLTTVNGGINNIIGTLYAICLVVGIGLYIVNDPELKTFAPKALDAISSSFKGASDNVIEAGKVTKNTINNVAK